MYSMRQPRTNIYLIFTWFTCVIAYLNASEDFYKINYLNKLVPLDLALRKRIITTAFCKDCDYLPKIEHAGKVIINGPIPYQLMHNGIRILKDCYYGAWMTFLIELLKGHHEPQEECIFHEVLKCIRPHAIMVEVGSYWGYYSLWFQQKIAHAKTYLIEPDLKNLKVGQDNFTLNNMYGHFFHAAVGSSTQERIRFIDWDYNEHWIKQICLDDFAKEYQIDFIDILHSDIQGAEIEMLKGCQWLIENSQIGYFFISTHRNTHDICLEILQKTHYEIILSIRRDESFAADGLIIAKLPTMDCPKNIIVSRRTEEISKLIEQVVT